jgi:hypothetical protein
MIMILRLLFSLASRAEVHIRGLRTVTPGMLPCYNM